MRSRGATLVLRLLDGPAMQKPSVSCLLLVFAGCGVDVGEEAPAVIKTGWIARGEGDFMPVTYVERADGTRMFQGDIRLGRVWDDKPGEHDRGAIRYAGRWGNNRVPYRIAPSIPNPQRIHDAIAAWNVNTPYYLVPHNGEHDYIVFDRNSEECSSPVGMQGGEQEIQVRDDCGVREVMHEIGHAIGMWHEQSRQDRDQFVNIDLGNVPSDQHHNFEKYPASEGYDWGLYDHDSIMHYSSFLFAIDKSRPTITRKDGTIIAPVDALSPLDRAATWNSGASGDPLRLKWLAFGSQLGWPTDRPGYNGNYRFLPTQNGRVYAASANGPYLEVHGDIARKYGAVGWATGFLGLPLTDESAVIDGRGRYNHFQNGSIYWTPQTGAHTVYGAIRDKWREIGAEGGFFGYPTTDESPGANGGRYNHFEGGSIYYSPATWVHTIYGAIREKWFAMGAESGYLGYPTTDELSDYPQVARYNHFQGGAIYYVPGVGVMAMPLSVRNRWAQLGWEQSCLRYPIGDYTDWGGGSGVQNFQGGQVWVSSYSGVWVYCNDRGWL
jgi:hypothetical protein